MLIDITEPYCQVDPSAWLDSLVVVIRDDGTGEDGVWAGPLKTKLEPVDDLSAAQGFKRHVYQLSPYAAEERPFDDVIRVWHFPVVTTYIRASPWAQIRKKWKFQLEREGKTTWTVGFGHDSDSFTHILLPGYVPESYKRQLTAYNRHLDIG